jgi:VanZ family protein
MGVRRYHQRRNAVLKFLSRWGPALAMMLIIYLASAQPKGSALMPDLGGWLDLIVKKGAHFLFYAVLGLGFLRGIRGDGPIARGTLMLAVLLTVVYAAGDEYHQTFVPGREGKWQDVAIDAAGASIALLLRYWSRLRSAQQPGRADGLEVKYVGH